MARVTKGNKAVTEEITIESSVKFLSDGSTTVTAIVDDEKFSWSTPSRLSVHAAVYAAAVVAMQDADLRGVTHLTLKTRANLVRRQATDEWAKRATQLTAAYAFYMLFRGNFDDVDWVTS